MKRFILSLLISIMGFLTAFSMSFSEAQEHAYYLTDKMAYELDLTPEQYDQVYQVNLEYLLNVRTSNPYNYYWEYRNIDLGCILFDWQYSLYCAAEYFYRPIVRVNRAWYFPVWDLYSRTHYYYSRPSIYATWHGGIWRGRHHRSPSPFYGHRPNTFSGGMAGHRGHVTPNHRVDPPRGGGSSHRPGFGNARPGGNSRPDHNTARPGGNSRPDHNTARPGGNNGRPDHNTARPGGNNGRPDHNTARPGGNNGRPDHNNARPGGNNGRPDHNNARPGGNSRPDHNTARPGGNTGRSDRNSSVSRTDNTYSRRDYSGSHSSNTAARTSTSATRPSLSTSRSSSSASRPSSSASRSDHSTTRSSGYSRSSSSGGRSQGSSRGGGRR